LVAVRVPDVLVLGMRNHQRRLVIVKNRREQELAVGENHFFFGHRIRITPDLDKGGTGFSLSYFDAD